MGESWRSEQGALGKSWKTRTAWCQYRGASWWYWWGLVLGSYRLGGAVSMETFEVESCFVNMLLSL